MNKRTLSEAEGMDVDEEISNKKIKRNPQNGLTISQDLKKMVLFQEKSMQMQQYSFGDEGKTKSSSCCKSRTELMSSYSNKETQSLEETKILLLRVRKLINKKN